MMSRPGCQVPSRAAAAGPAYRLVRGGEGGGVTSTGAVITGAARLTDHHNRSRALLPSFLPPPAHTDSDDGSGGKCTDLTVANSRISQRLRAAPGLSPPPHSAPADLSRKHRCSDSALIFHFPF